MPTLNTATLRAYEDRIDQLRGIAIPPKLTLPDAPSPLVPVDATDAVEMGIVSGFGTAVQSARDTYQKRLDDAASEYTSSITSAVNTAVGLGPDGATPSGGGYTGLIAADCSPPAAMPGGGAAR